MSSSTARSSAAMSGGEAPRRRKKKKKQSMEISILSLPYDLLLNCLARVSRLYYPTLSLVSRKFRSVVASPDLYATRSLLHRTESCLYMCLRFPRDPATYWFTLCRKPNRTITNKSSGNLFIPIPSPNLHPAESSTLVAAGSNIYKIGGYMSSSSRVSVLDCRFNTWHKAPRMRVRRSSPAVSLLDGKIYVAGGCKDLKSSNWIEVFDPKTQTWGNVTNPGTETRKGPEVKTLGIDGKLYLIGEQNVVYNPKEARWDPIGLGMDMVFPVFFTYGVIDDVLFHWNEGLFTWYDCKASLWKKLNGVEGLPDFHLRGYCKMVDLGGKMALLWDDYVSDGYGIWCAEIALERRNGGDEMWGKVEWFDVVLTHHKPIYLFEAHFLSATV